MSRFPTGVAVITALDALGAPWGMTCTSVCSVSLRPPTLLVCLRLGSPTLRAVLDLRTFGLNLLHSDARGTSELFASGDGDRFERVRWQLDEEAAGPHLTEDAHTTADCEVVHTAPVGDHMVVFGEVRRVTERHQPTPLLYGLRQYACWKGLTE
ncbi:flavin reductase family protein [Streptomyces sp. NPDC059909]|uniref:flavin reductase family protein n=1 Tax=Streptomyces sp. NPDC059909 TaxID=3346998 RepID=UPI00364DC33B